MSVNSDMSLKRLILLISLHGIKYLIRFECIKCLQTELSIMDKIETTHI
jgi:hypothetical protein